MAGKHMDQLFTKNFVTRECERYREMTVCVRGAGKAGTGIADILKTFYNMKVCFADANKEGEEDVYCVDESLQLYRNGTIKKYIIPLEYPREWIDQMTEQLLESDVWEEDILLATNRCSASIRLLNMNEYKTVLNNAGNVCPGGETTTAPIKYVICGSGWLEKYILSLLPLDSAVKYEAYTMKIEEEPVFIICDENLFYYKEIFSLHNSKVLYLYKMLQDYYFQGPLWYYQHSLTEITGDIRYLATGISHNRDAVFHNRILNLSNSGQDLKYDLAMLKKYYDLCKEMGDGIRGVIMGLYPYCLRYSMEESKANRKQNLRYLPLELEKYISPAGFAKEKEWFDYQKNQLDRYLPGFDIKELFYKYFLPAHGKIVSDYESFSASPEEKDRIREMIRKTYCKPYPDTVRENKLIMEEYFQFAEKAELFVLIVIPPYTELCRETWNPDYLRELKEFLEKMDEKYSFTVVDLSEKHFPDTYFYDAEHLNWYGRSKVMSVLSQYLDL